jgi:hypothetical protein
MNQIGTIFTACERFGVPTETIPSEFHDIPVYRNPRLRTALGKARFISITGERWIEIHKCVFANPEQMRKTLAHEVAHVIAGHAAGHNWAWKAVARGLGHSGERCATVETAERIGITRAPQRGLRVVAACERCGFEIKRRKRLSRNRTYTHPRCGGNVRSL